MFWLKPRKGDAQGRQTEERMANLFKKAMEVDDRNSRRKREDEMCLICGKDGAKCQCMEEQAGSPAGAAGDKDLAKEVERLRKIVEESGAVMTIGENEYEEWGQLAMMRTLVDHANKLAGMESAMYQNFAMKKGNKYWKEGKKGKTQFHEKGQEVKGRKIRIGTPHGWAGGKILMEMTQDQNITQTERDEVANVLLTFMKEEGGANKVDMEKIDKLEAVIAWVELNEGKEEDYILIGLKKGYERIEQILEKAMIASGATKREDRPPAPRIRDMKKAVAFMSKGKGKGRGKK